MSDASDFIVTVDRDADQAQKIIQRTVKNLLNKDIALVTVVESLESFIADDDPSIHSRAVRYLSRVITSLPSNFLNRQQVQVLTQFLSDRIEDDGSLQGLHTLVTLPRFNAEMAIVTYRALVEHYMDLQIRPQAKRFQVLALLDGLMQNSRKAIKDLGLDSLLGITELVSGEKDPRNLMIIFSILRVMIVEWDISHHAEAVFCYFPITFRPPPNDPYGITAQDLKTRLRDCLVASEYLAPFAFRQLIEKLDTSAVNVKRDVIDAINACASAYSPSTISQYSNALWDALKYEIFNAQEDYLMTEALSALTAIGKTLSDDLESSENSSLLDYLLPAIKECNSRLEEPQHKQAKAATKILLSFISCSPSSLEVTIKETLPRLLAQYEQAILVTARVAILECVLALLSAAATFLRTEFIESVTNSLAPLKLQLFEHLNNVLSGSQPEAPLHALGLRCMSVLCIIPGALDDSERSTIVQQFDTIAMGKLPGTSPSTISVLKDVAVECLIHISQVHSTVILDVTFPALMASLPDSTPTDDSYIAILETLMRISVERNISNTLVRRLFSRLEPALHGNSRDYPRMLLSTLMFTLNGQDLRYNIDLDRHFQKTFDLIKRCAKEIYNSKVEGNFHDISTMDILGQLACLILRNLNYQEQKTVYEDAYTLFDSDSNSSYTWRKEMPYFQRGTVVLSTHLIAGVNAKVPIPFGPDHYHSFLDGLIEFSTHEEDPFIRRRALQHLALSINKFASPGTLEWVENKLFHQTEGLLCLEHLTKPRLRVGFWISKALVCRLVNVSPVLLRLLDILEQPSIGAYAASAFSLLLRPDEIITKDNGAIIRRLAPQKVYHVCTPNIATRFRTANVRCKSNCLIALSGILKHTSTTVTLFEVDKLLPLLMQSLDMTQHDVKIAAIDTLTVIMGEKPQSLATYVPSLILRLLVAAGNAGLNNQALRSASLKCLCGLPGKLEDSKLIPYRNQVAKSVQVILDDHRREVRKEAVDCKTAWLNLDETEENF